MGEGKAPEQARGQKTRLPVHSQGSKQGCYSFLVGKDKSKRGNTGSNERGKNKRNSTQKVDERKKKG